MVQINKNNNSNEAITALIGPIHPRGIPVKTIFFLFCVFILSGCVQYEKPISPLQTLSPSELAKFTDRFGTLNEDLWEIYAESSDWQMENFQFADVSANGQLIIQTKKDTYSKGNLHSKFLLRGDYDIQIDCEAVLKAISGDMIYNLSFETATIREKPSDPWTGVFIEITKDPKEKKGNFGSGMCVGIENDDCIFASSKKISTFEGSLRIVRIGDQVRTMYKKKGSSSWVSLGKFSYHIKDQYIGISFSNSFLKHKKINAPISIKGYFDNFIINAAEGIIEADI